MSCFKGRWIGIRLLLFDIQGLFNFVSDKFSMIDSLSILDLRLFHHFRYPAQLSEYR